MSSPVLPKPEQLHSTKNCELAAMLVTMGFEPVDDAMATVTGDGVPGGRLGYWRFLPTCTGGRFLLSAALANGCDPHQAAKHGTPLCPVYTEQAYIAAGFHNYRMLVEQLKYGTALELRPCGVLYLLQRCGTGTPPDTATAAALAEHEAHGSRNTQLAAAMATLGFTLRSASTATPVTALSHGVIPRTWYISETSLDGRWQRDERLARWANDAWCSRPQNNDPIACMADAFFNLNQLRARLQSAAGYARVQHGKKSVLLRTDAGDAAWQKAENFLTRN